MDTWNAPLRSANPRRCNLCECDFVPRNRFERICKECKSGSEIYRFHDAWPEAEALGSDDRLQEIA